MKSLIKIIIISFIFFSIPSVVNAMWAALSDMELVEQSEIIVSGEIMGQTRVMIKQVPYDISVLKVDKALKGGMNRTVILLLLPASRGPQKSDDIFYKTGQRGLWFLRERKSEGEAGLYLADHPQRFVSEEYAAEKIKSINAILSDKEQQTRKTSR